jgi:hypothetical protein
LSFQSSEFFVFKPINVQKTQKAKKAKSKSKDFAISSKAQKAKKAKKKHKKQKAKAKILQYLQNKLSRNFPVQAAYVNPNMCRGGQSSPP